MGSFGSTTGEGNPPGKYSEGYLSGGDGNLSSFVKNSSYKNYGELEASGGEVGNQPKEKSMATLESRSNKKESFDTSPSK